MPPTFAAERAAEYRESPEYHDAPPICALCRQPITEDNADPIDPELHEVCAGQRAEEDLLDQGVERLIGDLAELLREYAAGRAPRLESAGTREQVARLREAERLIVSTLTGVVVLA